MSKPGTLIIAEAGVNHNGSLDLAKKLIDVAADSGADIVKFQTFRPEMLSNRTAKKAEYQTQNTGTTESQFEMLKRLALSEDDHFRLIEQCRHRKIEFLSTPFEEESLGFLSEKCGISLFKIPSGELTNGPFLIQIAETARKKDGKIILSTGMSTLDEVRTALSVLAFGLIGTGTPSDLAFSATYGSPIGKKELEKRVTVLHCTTEYPAPFETVNLRAIRTLSEAFDLPVGFSDHTMGISAPLAAVALGAVVIEKHFTLDRTMAGPDHRASLEPAELFAMVKGIREVENSLGSSEKKPSGPEFKNIAIARKVLVAKKAISAGEKFSEENLTAKRSGTGISPMHYWSLLGSPARRAYNEDETID